MTDHIYKKVELVGSSQLSIEQAVQNALTHAAKSIRNIRWLEVGEIRCHVDDAKIDHWQVGVKVGFTLEQTGAPETLEEKHHAEHSQEAVTRAVGGKALTK